MSKITFAECRDMLEALDQRQKMTECDIEFAECDRLIAAWEKLIGCMLDGEIVTERPV